MNTSEILNRAADLIESRGWGQGTMSWSGCEGSVCIDEALALAQGFTGCNVPPEDGGIWLEDLAASPAAVAVTEYLGLVPDLVYPRREELLYGWNDKAGRTADEVIGVLRACALVEAARERDGFIGDDPREVEFEPLEAPAVAPVTVPEQVPAGV